MVKNENGNGCNYTEEEKKYIIKMYHTTKVKDIAVHISHEYYSVAWLIRKLRKSGAIKKPKHDPFRIWSDNEVEYLQDYYGIKDPEKIASYLHRKPSAIITKAHKLRIRQSDAFYNYYALAEELGRCRLTLRKYYEKGWLKGKKAPCISYYGLQQMVFREKDIVKFLKSHYRLFEIRKLGKIKNRYFRNIVKECYG